MPDLIRLVSLPDAQAAFQFNNCQVPNSRHLQTIMMALGHGPGGKPDPSSLIEIGGTKKKIKENIAKKTHYLIMRDAGGFRSKINSFIDAAPIPS